MPLIPRDPIAVAYGLVLEATHEIKGAVNNRRDLQVIAAGKAKAKLQAALAELEKVVLS